MPYDRYAAPCAVEDIGRFVSSFFCRKAFIEAPFAFGVAQFQSIQTSCSVRSIAASRWAGRELLTKGTRSQLPSVLPGS